MSHWNHRVLAHKVKDEEPYFQIHEVYYNDEEVPDSYTLDGVTIGGDDIKEIYLTLNRMKKCLDEPILWAGDKFPQVYELIKQKEDI